MDRNRNFENYLGRTVDCACGRTHSVGIGTVEISTNALNKVAGILRKDGYKKPFVVADCNTHKVAGEKLLTLLTKEQIPFSSYIFDDPELIPNEQALGQFLINFDPDCDLILAVGGGTLNDLSRFVSYRLGLPFYIVATAPSMDGYASTGAPLIKNNYKISIECHEPRAIIADLDIIANAPKRMIAAGFGDVIGKYTALADWELSAIINGEYYCETVVDMIRQSLQRTVAAQEGIASGDPKAIGELMEALILSGIAMSYVQSSRPASGCEHRLSHFWEMRFLLEGKKSLLHGTKVGIATVLALQLYKFLREEGLSTDTIIRTNTPNVSHWETEIRSAFLEAAPEILLLEERIQKNSIPKWKERIKVIAEHWPRIESVLSSVPDVATVSSLLAGAGGPVHASDVGIDHELVHLGILYAKEVRPPYTILQLLWDLGLLTDYATRLAK